MKGLWKWMVVAGVVLLASRRLLAGGGGGGGGGSSSSAGGEQGGASWYGPGFHGKLTANGEVFDQEAMTAAHKTLRFNTRVLVTDLETGQQVTVRINDRGPFVAGRIIDLSKGAARALGTLEKGVTRVELRVLS